MERAMRSARRFVLPLVVRTSRGPLRPLWALAYRVAAWAVGARLVRGEAAAVYLRGSGGGPDVVHGLSDLDLAVIAEDDRAAERVRERWRRLRNDLEPLGRPVECHYVEPRAAVEAACAATVFTHGLDGSAPGRGASEMQERPHLDGEVARWRRIRGPELRPHNAGCGHAELERPLVAWLELQFWWRHVFTVAASPPDRWLALSCVKLVAEPLRTLLWLEDGRPRGTRREVLEEARGRAPGQEPSIAYALDLSRRLAASPAPDIGLVVRSLAEVSALVARRIEGIAGELGHGHVALEGLTADRPLEAAPEGTALPLVDWRARTLMWVPDAVFVVVPGDPADATRLSEVAESARTPVNPVLRHGELLMALPTMDAAAARLRGAQCPASDPVSFALASGGDQAAFPELPGWSARDAARRAVHEQAVRLPLARRTATGGEALARLFAAGRSALMLQSQESGTPVLTLTATATATALIDEAGADRTTVEEALGGYLESRARRAEPPVAVVEALRAELLALPGLRPPSTPRTPRASHRILHRSTPGP
jgi:hypothetical protein